MSFTSLGLSPCVQSHLQHLGYQQPTPIQSQAIGPLLAGTDLLAVAETGSGKTAAFLLPLLEKMHTKARKLHAHQVRTLVLVPTRELAIQIHQAALRYASAYPKACTALAIYGGVSINTQMQAMRTGCDLILATPGRLLDLLEKNAISLSQVEHLVLDEADRLLDLGFSEAVQTLMAAIPKHCQRVLLSATFPPEVQTLAQSLLVNAHQLDLTPSHTFPTHLNQRALLVDKNKRTALLRHLLSTHPQAQFLVFVASKRGADQLVHKLHKYGFTGKTLHADRSQKERQSALARFQAGEIQVLIATDVAARGLDIAQLAFVINYDLPRSSADYVHRIGRSARAGATGTAISLIDPDSEAHFRLIEKRYQIRLERESLADFAPSPSALSAPTPTKGPAPVKGRRKSKKDKLREAQQRKTHPGT
ncbi:Superfamily II DNA and RNA helicase [Allopseudospirillum japonicum]|uniref:Superfamily II DNA and RNA helicase n=1 Tax=Allopseudospirillum japonicum TaxID=64971 RepID=A0A1H6S9D9_9GAMM|nr:DEAD/DEAH box helicase [Allopseudospirillum japonicum]SEI64718.1 Superfamily II DNA and RNA helicase [Allopseudospirillum japonicum]